MSANLALALNDLRSFADAKLSLLDDLGKQHSDWLTVALNGLNERRNRKADGPPPGDVEALKRPRGRPPRPTRGAKSKSVPKVAQEDDPQPSEPAAVEPNTAIAQEIAPTRKRVTRSRAAAAEGSEGLPISNADAPVRRSSRTSKSATSESARLEDIPVATEAVRTRRSTHSSVVSVPSGSDSPGNEPVPDSSKKRKEVTKSTRPASSKKGKPPQTSDDVPEILGAEPSPRLDASNQDCHDNMPEMEPDRLEPPVVAELHSSHGGEQGATVELEAACDAEGHSPKVMDLPTIDADQTTELEASTSPGVDDMELPGVADHLEESRSPKRSGGTPQVSNNDAEIDSKSNQIEPKTDAEELMQSAETTSEAPPTIDADAGSSPAQEESSADKQDDDNDDEPSEKETLNESRVEADDAPSVAVEPEENDNATADQDDDDVASGAAAEPLKNDHRVPTQLQQVLPDSATDQPEPQAPPPARSMASNLVSAVRSLLPLGGGGGVIRGGGPVSFLATSSAPQQQPKPPARVAALEKAEAARKAQEAKEAERERRKQDLERLKAERQAAKAVAEAEAAAARAEQAQRKQREAAARRQQLHQNSSQQTVKKADSDAVKHGVRPVAAGGGVNPGSSNTSAAPTQLSDSSRTVPQQAARPLKKIMYQGQHQSVGAETAQALPKQANSQLRLTTNPNAGKTEEALKPHTGSVLAPSTKQPGPEQLENQAAKSMPTFQANKAETATNQGSAFPRLVLNPLATNRAPMVQATTATSTDATTPTGQQQRPRASSHGSQYQYEISPYRSDEDESSEGDDGPKKPVPEWAKGKRLQEQLVDQMRIDPDEIFQQQHKTCTLDEMFEKPKNGQRDFSRRTSTGNWAEDRLTWQEELRYKKAMGFI